MAYASTIAIITSLAFFEEVIKAVISRILRGTYFFIPSLFILPILEFWLIFPEVNEYLLTQGVNEQKAFLLSSTLLIGSQLFHVFTSILYAKEINLYLSIMFCTIIHTGFNILAQFLPRLDISLYIGGAWLTSGLAGIAIIFFYKTMSKRN